MAHYDTHILVDLEAESLLEAVEGLARVVGEVNGLIGVSVSGTGGLDEREPEQGQ